MIYAENGRGKTTLATILHSLGDKKPLPIIERTRLGGLGDPHIVIANNSGETAVFQNGTSLRCCEIFMIFVGYSEGPLLRSFQC